ncbi:MAG: tRNA (adenosine(37)-N6)-threonylcarbamoyltransferase complex ATPase subunit type 1 TsaE [Desulfovibrionaceae bacterium]|nr:tRNA (adenosine(37)-N6)-threonylcarbamoyltransferase complex ATPase subunit type 1 TsaE [Desulfovibrionaceae bacterium]
MLTLVLHSLEETAALGRRMAALLRTGPLRVLLLRGDLGAGKTTLTRALVQALPGGDDAEISSPSFTICNCYPTRPPVAHCDLYRSAGSLPDDVLDALEDEGCLVIIEWAELLPEADMPQEYLDISLQSCKNERHITLHAHGAAADLFLRGLQQGTMA